MRYSVACRTVFNANKEPVAGGHGGWYGQPGDKCPKCGHVVIVTGAFEVIDL